MPVMDDRDAAVLCARIADEHKATDVKILEVRELIVVAAYFVICTGRQARQLRAIADDIHTRLKAAGLTRYGRAGYEEGSWILLDYGDVVIHIFDEETRRFYDLEMLWGDAPVVEWV